MKRLHVNRLVLFTGLMLGLLLVLGACGVFSAPRTGVFGEDPNALRVPLEVVEGCSDVRTETCQQSGHALLTPILTKDGQLSVFIKVGKAATEYEPQPAYIYSGRCASLGDKAITLEGVIAGESRNRLVITLASLTDGNHAIAFHRTGLALRAAAQGEAPVIGCGDIPTQ